MSEPTLTHKDLATLLGVSETTVKSYRRKFPGCIPVASQGKPIRFTQEAAAVATRIRDLFGTGMSVEEVRTRLSAEFSFIPPLTASAKSAKGKSARQTVRGTERSEVAPELSAGISNMAKSMVAMTQQQKAMLGRMQAIEKLLEELELALPGDEAQEGQGPHAALAPRSEAARQREALLEERLTRLDNATAELSQHIKEMGARLQELLGKRAKAAAAWEKTEAETMAAAAAVVEATAPLPAETSEKQAAERTTATVIPLHPGAASERVSPELAMARAAKLAAQHTQNQDAADAQSPAEPPRQFFALPLVVRTAEGHYASAGGRSRGRFSLNDLKAMLIYGFTPPNHFTLHWEKHGQGWWLHLEQEGTGEQRIRMLLMELPTQKGTQVTEILQLRHNDNAVHPAEICAIIDSFGAQR